MKRVAWNRGKNKEEYPQLSNSGVKKGNIPWNKGLKGLGAGIPRTKEAKRKISEATKGRKGLSGKNNPAWKGGRTPLVRSIRTCGKYFQWRSDVYQRDNWTCQTCNKRGERLNAHHKKSFQRILDEYKITSFIQAMVCAELWDVDNGVTLCEDCHLLTKGGNHLKSRNG